MRNLLLIEENKLKIAVGALVVNAEGEVLSVTRRGKPMDLCIPGGSAEPGETEAEALLRELLEETGVKATKFYRIYAMIDSGGCWFVLFLVTDWEGTPGQQEEGVGVAWVAPTRLLSNDCTFRENNRTLFRFVGLI